MAQKLDPASIVRMRTNLNLTQKKFAHMLGMSLGAYQKIESGASAYRSIHQLAAERITLEEARKHNDYGLLAESALDDVLKLYDGQLPNTKGAERRTYLRYCDLLRYTFGIIADNGFYLSDVFVPSDADVTFERLPEFAGLITDPGIRSHNLVPNICNIRALLIENPKLVKIETLRSAKNDIDKVLEELSNHYEAQVNTAPAKAREFYDL